MTQAKFLETYRNELFRMYDWAKDAVKLTRYMDSVRATLEDWNTWNCDGEAMRAAWVAIGGKGKCTLKALRALPKE